MIDVPDCWPPPDDLPAKEQVVPLFPLANVWLVPHAVMPLHIFEPRYRAMVEAVLDGSGELVLGTVVQGHESDMQDAPPVHPVAGLGQIVQFEKLPDGRFLIMLLGKSRVRIAECESDHEYRLVSAAQLEETPAPVTRESELREKLTGAILARSEDLLNLPDNLPIGCLADLLALRLNPPHQTWQQLYSTLDAERRAEIALDLASD
ncbi:LON peptidase substrate-binding domain-containing protein [Engelhardtia mirabilis]|uniref:Lon protease n=1 Tax=Engelhardtia mirabilis TaxID=2528011 RepID=A0A518BHT4_9BACT|nr:Lon protease [Planctomycetes bacterium Pla133]QDV00873.1 Lon protease [Planctomycetes bacterium Pla86]